MPDAKITLYGAPWCPDCKRSKQFLGEQRVPYTWIDIDQDEKGRRYVCWVSAARPSVGSGEASQSDFPAS